MKPRSEPGRSREDVQAVIGARRDAMRACYDRARQQNPGLEGEDIVVRWTIDPKGSVTDAAVDPTKSTIVDPAVGRCIVDLIAHIKFAESSKGFETRTSYPFHFNPRSGGKMRPDAGP